MIILLDDEADAFWCFEHLMRKLVYYSFIQSHILSGFLDIRHVELIHKDMLRNYGFLCQQFIFISFDLVPPLKLQTVTGFL